MQLLLGVHEGQSLQRVPQQPQHECLPLPQRPPRLPPVQELALAHLLAATAAVTQGFGASGFQAKEPTHVTLARPIDGDR